MKAFGYMYDEYNVSRPRLKKKFKSITGLLNLTNSELISSYHLLYSKKENLIIFQPILGRITQVIESINENPFFLHGDS